MSLRSGVLLMGIVLGASACALPPGPATVGSDASSRPKADAPTSDQASRLDIQQRPLREIPSGEISRIRQVIDRRRNRFLTPLPQRDSTRLGIRLYVTSAETEIKRLTDQARALSGNVSALQPNASLQAIARAHSQDMADRGQLSLVGSDGMTGADRLNQAGITFLKVGMRVHRAPAGSFTLSPTDTDATIRLRREDWLNRSQGDGNPLDPAFYDVGIGVVRGSDGNLYITAIFRQPTF